MSFDWTAIEEEAKSEIAKVNCPKELELLRIKYLGRQGKISEITSSIPTLPLEVRPEFGKKVNFLKNKLNQLLEEKTKQLRSKQQEGVSLRFDITLPGEIPQIGSRHPIAQTIQEVTSIFSKMGFAIVEGPEIETEYNNFTGLNIPLDHPSRDAFDTFYLKSRRSPVASLQSNLEDPRPETGDRRLLRSHTSPVQIRVMKSYKPPLAIVVPGKVYRPDATDATHAFMFHQVEGFLVDEEVRFSDLKGILSLFLKKLFGEDIKMRFRPHFFPFTEPSAEVDISCILCARNQKPEYRNQKNNKTETQHPAPSTQHQKCSVCGGKGWLEILGCGMIHPNVFKNVGYSKDKYSGFAFGMGVDRIAMLKYGIADIRLFYENDLRFLRQF